jgi:UDP-glucose 4-epimerase
MLCRLLCAIDSKADGEVFNLGSKDYVNLKDLAALMVELHKSGKYEMVPFPPERKVIDIGDFYSDYSKISKVLGWEPKVSLREGLQSSLNYYSQTLNHYL